MERILKHSKDQDQKLPIKQSLPSLLIYRSEQGNPAEPEADVATCNSHGCIVDIWMRCVPERNPGGVRAMAQHIVVPGLELDLGIADECEVKR
jgi:hypothetical protein